MLKQKGKLKMSNNTQGKSKLKKGAKAILIWALLATMFCGASYCEHNYTRGECRVVRVSNGLASIEDKAGFIWDYEDGNLNVGDIVDLKMHDNLSGGYIDDDVIREIVKR